MAACVKLQPQNTEDKSRGTTQTCTAKSYERVRGNYMAWKQPSLECEHPNFISRLFLGHNEPGCEDSKQPCMLVRRHIVSSSMFLQVAHKVVYVELPAYLINPYGRLL